MSYFTNKHCLGNKFVDANQLNSPTQRVNSSLSHETDTTNNYTNKKQIRRNVERLRWILRETRWCLTTKEKMSRILFGLSGKLERVGKTRYSSNKGLFLIVPGAQDLDVLQGLFQFEQSLAELVLNAKYDALPCVVTQGKKAVTEEVSVQNLLDLDFDEVSNHVSNVMTVGHKRYRKDFTMIDEELVNLEEVLHRNSYTVEQIENDAQRLIEWTEVARKAAEKAIERERIRALHGTKAYDSSSEEYGLLSQMSKKDLKFLGLKRKITYEYVTQGAKTLEPSYSREDLCQRLAKLGVRDFHLAVTKQWGHCGKNKTLYLQICKQYRVNPKGRTESIPTVNCVRNLTYKFNVGPHVLSEYCFNSRSTFDLELDKILAIVCQHEQLKMVIGIVSQGSGVSKESWRAMKSSDERSLRRKGELSLFMLPTVLMESLLVAIDKLLSELGIPIGLPSIRVAEWLIFMDYCNKPDWRNLARLGSTTFLPWLSDLTNLSITALMDYFRGEEQVEVIYGDVDNNVLREQDYVSQGGNPFDILMKARHSPMWKKISTMVYYAVGSTFLQGSELGAAINGALRIMGDSIGESVDGILSVNDALSYIYKRFLVVLETGDLTEFFEPDPITTAVLELNAHVQLMQKKDHVDPRAVLAEATLLVTKHTKSTHPLVVAACRSLFGMMNTFSSTLTESRRAPPGYIFVGPPGTGKGTLVERLASTMKAIFEIDQSINITYTHQGTAHQTLPAVSHIMLLNDFLAVKDEKSPVNMLEFMQQIVDTTLLKVETASLDEKANSILAPKLALGTTNSMQYSFTTNLAGGPCKLNRRWLTLLFELAPWYLEKYDGNYETALRELGRGYVPGSVTWRFGELNIPSTSINVDFSFAGGQTIYEDLIYTDINAVVSRIMKHVLKNMSVDRPVYDYDCEGCRLTKEYCVCKNVASKGKVVFTDADFLRIEDLKKDTNVNKQKVFISKKKGKIVTQGAAPSIPINVVLSSDTKGYFDTFKENLVKSFETSTSPEKLKEVFDHLTKDLRVKLDEVSSKFTKSGLMLGNAIVCLGVAGALITMIRMLWKGTKVAQGTTISSLINVPKPVDEIVPPYFGKKLPWLGNSVLHKVVNFSWDENGPSYATHGLWICKDLLMLPYHLMRDNGDYSGACVIKYGNQECTAYVDPLTVHQINCKDAMLLHVPSSVGIYDGAAGKFPRMSAVPTRGWCMGREVLNLKKESDFILSGDLPNTQKGDCGSPLFDDQGMIYGIFIGYDPRTGDAVNARRLWTAISQSDIDQGIAGLLSKGIKIEEQTCLPPPAVQVISQGNSVKEGYHPKGVIHYYELYEKPDVHELVIPVFNCPNVRKFSCKVQPTKLRQEFTEDELPRFSAPFGGKVAKYEENGVMKYNAPLLKQLRAFKRGSIPFKDGREAVKSYLTFFKTKTRIKPISLYTSVCGSPFNTLINARDNSKSLGPSAHILYSMNRETAFKKVKDSNNIDSFEMDPRLIADADEWYRHFFDFSSPVRPILVKASRKAEAKEESKAVKGTARIFSVGDVAFNLAFRRIILPVIQHIMSQPYESGVFGCLNAGSEEWTVLADWLKVYGTLAESDQETMDGHHDEATYWYTEFMTELSLSLGYSKDEARALSRAIKCTVTYYMEMEGDWVYMDWRLNSGLPDTLVRNSVIGFLLVLIILSKRGVLLNQTITDKKKNKHRVCDVIRMANVGDDNLTAVHPDVPFLEFGLIKEYSELGYSLTRADKKPGEITPQTIYQSTFLKRGFVEAVIRGERFVLAPLEIKSILKALCYSVDVSEADLDVRNRGAILCAMNELFLHGEQVFNTYKLRIEKWVDFKLPEYKSLEELFITKRFELWSSEQDSELYSSSKIPTAGDAGSLTKIVTQGDRRPNPIVNDRNTQGIFSIAELNNNLTTELNNEGTVAHLVSTTTEIEDVSSNFLTLRHKPTEESLQQFFRRPRLLMTMSVGPQGYVQVGAFQTYRVLPVVAKVLSQWMLFRGDLKLKVMVTGSPRLNAKARLYAYPVLRETEYGVPRSPYGIDGTNFYENFCTTSQLPHVDIDCSKTGNYELNLSWPSPYDYLDIQSAVSDWDVKMVAVNHPWMVDGTTVEPLPIHVYASYENVVLETITNQGEVGGSFSRGLRFAAHVASQMPFSWANPFSKIANLGADVASHFGYSRLPAEAENVVVSRLTDNPNLGEGQFDASQTLGMNDVALVSAAKSPLGVPDDVLIKTICARRAQVMCAWQSTRPIVMSPCLLSNVTATDVVMANWRMTPMSHLSLMFDKWTGSLMVCVEVTACAFVRGRLGLVVVPPNVAVPVAFPRDGSFLTLEFDVVGQTCVEMRIPYLYGKIFKSTEVVLTSSTDVDTTRLVYFWLVGPFDMGATRAPDINLYMWGGDDLEFAVPDMEQANYFDIVTQGKVGLNVYGEEVTSVLTLAKRRSFRHNSTLITGSSMPVWRAIQTPSASRCYTFVYWLSLPFHALSGSLSYLYRLEGDPFAKVHEAMEGFQAVVGTQSRGVVYADRGVIQVRVPDRCGAHFWSPYLDLPSTGNTRVLHLTGETDTDYDVLQAGGDDFTVSGYLCAPVITQTE
jgi:hypothetical protein